LSTLRDTGAEDMQSAMQAPPEPSTTLQAPPGESPSILRGIRRDVVLLGAGNIGIVLAQLGFRGILVTALIPADYGRLSLLLSIYNTIWIIGASGLPNSVARYIATASPAEDHAIIKSAIRAGVLPTVIATVVVAAASGLLLHSAMACLLAAVGLPCLVYSLLTMGILRGRGCVGPAASIMLFAAIGEVGSLAVLWRSGAGVTLLSAFAVFCLGNAVGLTAGIVFVLRTTPDRPPRFSAPGEQRAVVPSSRQLLSFSAWLGVATLGLTLLPLVVRFVALFDSYTVVAIVDVALVLLGIPQRVGTVLVYAVVPHAARALKKGQASLAITRREHILIVLPFVLMAAIVAFTPLVGEIFSLLGRPEYAQSGKYLAMALLASPARVLYGLVEGVLIAHGEGRFLAFTCLGLCAVASILIVAVAAAGSVPAAFAVFVVAFWAIYLVGFLRIGQLTASVTQAS
jgi:O-antigen/teichoic acid export membrane protein